MEELTKDELMELGEDAEKAGNFEEAKDSYLKACEAGTTAGLAGIGLWRC